VYLAKEKIQDYKTDLQPKIDKMLKNKAEADKIVYIKSGVGVNYGSVVEVINLVRKSGVDKIGLVADKKKKGGAAAPATAAPAT
ncbi:MAG: hypothetical protein QOD00_917, partial [Blastocatellia bacterium]|nr:hypothetical protein [Blastocatellia bacterium]